MKLKVTFLLLLAIVSVGISYGQKINKKITITGNVLDDAKKPIVDAIIIIDDQKTDKVTDSKGSYKIKVKPDVVKIGIFTFANGVAEEVIGGRTQINFTLGTMDYQQQLNRNDASGEEEINIGYGTVKRKNLITSVSKIDGTNKRYASYNSIYDMILGEVPGVQVQGKSIKIQGASSLILSTEPLFVIDGIIVNSIDEILPQMVRSIEVLKGSSASIYGSRGANGVILINLLGAKDVR